MDEDGVGGGSLGRNSDLEISLLKFWDKRGVIILGFLGWKERNGEMKKS